MSGRAGRWLIETRIGRLTFRIAAVVLIAGATYAVVREEVGRQTGSITKRIRVIEEVSPFDVVHACLRSPSCRRLLAHPDRVRVKIERHRSTMSSTQSSPAPPQSAGGDPGKSPPAGPQPPSHDNQGHQGGEPEPPPVADESIPPRSESDPTSTGSSAGGDQPEPGSPASPTPVEETAGSIAGTVEQVGKELGAVVGEITCSTTPICAK